MKICTNITSARLIMHAGIIEVLSSLESFELYPYYIGQSDVCHNMFISTLRLLLSLSTAEDRPSPEHVNIKLIHFHESYLKYFCLQFSTFLSLRGSVLSDILRMAANIKSTPTGISVFTLITGILSKLIITANKQLQRSFMTLLTNYLGSIDPSEIKIVINLLIGYVRICMANGKCSY